MAITSRTLPYFTIGSMDSPVMWLMSWAITNGKAHSNSTSIPTNTGVSMAGRL